MAFNPLPQTWFAGLTDDGTDITLPIASIPELSAAEIDAATGDIRKMLYAITELAWTKWNALPTADRPAKMTINKSASVNATTGLVTNTYVFTFVNAITGQDVATE